MYKICEKIDFINVGNFIFNQNFGIKITETQNNVSNE